MGTVTQDTSATACLGLAISQLLRARYPQHTVKSVAVDLRCTPKSAENLLDGHLSASKATRLIEVYGPGFMAEAVMLSAGTTLENFIDQQAEAAEQAAARQRERAIELRHLKARLATARRGDAGLDRRRA